MKTVLIFAPHPDDAEFAMGGTIAKMISNGTNVILADMSDGEPTPHGSKLIRASETRKASEILSIKTRINLEMPNRYISDTIENRKKTAETIRLYKPDVIFSPTLPDWHPDHHGTHKLIEAARFEAKYSKTDTKGLPHWTPEIFYYYSPHRAEYQKPDFIVDITDYWNVKILAVNTYRSQIKNTIGNEQANLIEKTQIVNKFFGLPINAKYGEPFMANQPISTDTFAILEI